MSGATKEIGAPEYRIGKFQWNFVLTPRRTMISNPGTWTRRHRSEVVSVRNLAKSKKTFSKHAERLCEERAGPDSGRSCNAKHGGLSRIKEPVCDSQIAICY
jgi:hypothetical protein